MIEVGGGEVLAGAMGGRRDLGRLLERTAAEPAAPGPLFLDFTGIVAATASYLRESVVAFRSMIRSRNSIYYPVIANANEAVRDELLELSRRGDVFLTCELSADGSVHAAALLGELEGKQQLKLRLVQDHGETDAGGADAQVRRARESPPRDRVEQQALPRARRLRHACRGGRDHQLP